MSTETQEGHSQNDFYQSEPRTASSRASAASLIRPWPGSSYSGSEVHGILDTGRLPLTVVGSSTAISIDDSGRLPPGTPGVNKDGTNDACQPTPSKRQCTDKPDDNLRRDSLDKDLAKQKPASRLTRLHIKALSTSTSSDKPAEGRARSRSR